MPTIFLSLMTNFLSAFTVFIPRFFDFQFRDGLSCHCSQRGGGLAQAGDSLSLGRAQNFQIRTNFQASHCPACLYFAK
jgi:hypothetical protein